MSINTSNCCRMLLFLGACGLVTIANAQPKKTVPHTSTIYRGRVNGDFSYNANGAAQYTIPLQIPPGTAGAQPDLTITYSSQNSNGLLGMGFSLTGLSAVSRTRASIAEDGFAGGINYDSCDRFSLDGNRMMNTDPGAATYASPGSVFMTELQTWTKLQAFDSLGSGPAYFKAWLKNGATASYGATADASVEAQGPRFVNGPLTGSIKNWLIDQLTDRNGNTIRYTYSYSPTNLTGNLLTGSSNNSTAYPNAIYYSGNLYTSSSEQRKIQFYYEPRQDTLLYGSGGAETSVYLRLKAIRTFVVIANDTVPVSTYLLGYDNTNSDKVSRVTSIYRVGQRGDSTVPLSFKWSDGPDGLVQAPGQWTGPGAATGGYVADLNRDGKTDLIPAQQNMINAIYLSTSRGFSQVSLSQPLLVNKTSYLADYNADGYPDLLVATGGAGNIYYGNGAGFAPGVAVNGLQIDPACTNCTWTADFNGDGRADVLTVSGNLTTLHLADTVNFLPPINISGLSLTPSQIWVADFNADGQADVLSTGVNAGNLYLSDFSHSGSFRPVIATVSMNVSPQPANNLVADFNADGLADILTHVNNLYSLYLSNGYGFDSARSITNVNLNISQNWLSDFNGDGCMDFYALMGDSAAIYYYYGTGFTRRNASSPALIATGTWSGDFNGDGIADLFAANTNTMYFGAGTQSAEPALVNQVPGLLTRIDNGIHGSIKFEFRPMSDSLIYRPTGIQQASGLEGLSTQNNFNAVPLSPVQVSQYPYVQTQNSLYLLAAYRLSDGYHDSYHYKFNYQGSLQDLDGYGWLGFSSVTEVDSAANNIFQNNYLQPYPFTGKKASKVKTDLSGQLLRVVRNQYSSSNNPVYSGSPVYQVTQSQARQDFYENGAFAFTLGTNYGYDRFGNVVREALLNDTSEPLNTIYTNSMYVNDTLGWHIGFTKSSVKSPDSLGATPLQQSAFQYDTVRYNLLAENQWLNTNNSWLSHQYQYDAYGNRSWQVNESGDTTWMYTDSIYHSFTDKVVSPPDASGKRLVMYARFDPAFGVMTQSVDANGNLFTIGLDQFGQDSLRTGPAPSGTQKVITRVIYQLRDTAGFIVRSLSRRHWEGNSWDSTYKIYDGLSREIGYGWRGSQQQAVFEKKEYNSNNLVTRHSLPYFAGAKPKWVTNTYDPNQRILTTRIPFTDSADVTTQYAYSGKQISMTEAAGTKEAAQSSRVFDYFNGNQAIVQVKDANGLLTVLNYDLLGRLSMVTDPGKLVTGYGYNSIGDMVSLSNPASGNTAVLYNYAGRQRTVVMNAGDSIWLEYDALNRKTAWYSRSGAYYYQYDLAGSQNGNANLCRVYMPDSSCYYSFGYNAFGQLTNTRMHIAGKVFDQKMRYLPDLSPDHLIYPDSSQLTYHYYPYGFLEKVKWKQKLPHAQSEKEIFRLNKFDAAGNITNMVYGNGVRKIAGFYPFGILKAYQVLSPFGMPVTSMKYRWNFLHQLSGIEDQLDHSKSEHYHFQPNGQLDSARGPYGLETYSYDSSGSLVQKGADQFIYNNYQVQSGMRGGKTFFNLTYDGNGNRYQLTRTDSSSPATTRYVFDNWNRLKALVSNADTIFRFTYDMQGRRLSKTDVRSGTTTYYISPQFEWNAGSQRSSQTAYISTGGGRVAEISSSYPALPAAKGKQYRISDGLFYYHQDFLNNTKQVTDATGKTRYKVSYKPYGTQYGESGKNLVRYHFGGKELDESGLNYFEARYYDTLTGRFISADDRTGGSLGMPGIYNRYAYVSNNPVQNMDPTGHFLSTVAINVLMGIVDLADPEGALALTAIEQDLTWHELENMGRHEIGHDFYNELRATSLHAPQEMRGTYREAYMAQRAILHDIANLPVAPMDHGYLNVARYGRDAFGTRVFFNTAPNNLEAEILTRNIGLHNPGNIWLHNIEEVGQAINTGNQFKFTLSTEDFRIKISNDFMTHAALEGNGGPVYTAGMVQRVGNVLRVLNHSGHYRPTLESLRMADAWWNVMRQNEDLQFQIIEHALHN
ncbi:FG-GAP-like repeat-containing protein [Paraflavitalea sp. CAU 1676]|uniref:FG-GAP-like repeat-containing protein n=1 Tax=Paraflavitalea sp. CAU 1676 TaxID=3032598 RepID=UPI0023D9AC6B|nr:FG-GAP-like repeat-containing protein [Paraflavitalea sp. CAU 1676]MDF2188404.1 FG-GAP-like repeat-containing protein [Paraflavitalea sp. CAU 1676]